MKYLLAIDAGTGSIRAVIFDENAKQKSSFAKEWVHVEQKGVPNSMDFDCEKNWSLVLTCIKGAIKKANINSEDILALSATSMREGVVLYDKNKEAIWGVANVDARADKEVKELKKLHKNIEEKFYKTSGQTFALGALPRLLWLKKHRPQIYKKAKHISMIGDWILAKLSSKIASDPSNGGTSGVFSLKKRQWDSKMAKKVGIKTEIFGDILECGEVLGYVNKTASKQSGLSTNTKVVMGGGDVQLGSAGLGVVNENDVGILGGSFWQQVVNIPKDTEPPKDMNMRINPHVIPTLSQAEGITFFSGIMMRWFRDTFCALEVKEAKKRGIDVYELLEEKARKIPVGSYGILPIFSDSMKYSKWYHASPSFINMDLDTTSIGAIFRALEENACIVSSINLENVKKFSNVDFKEIVFAGGASKGKLWCQILSDVTNCTVKIPKITEATALGAAFAAGVGAGIYKSIEHEAKKRVKWDRVYTPNPKNHKKYQIVKKRWQKVYNAQLDLVNKGLTKSMWMAPGVDFE